MKPLRTAQKAILSCSWGVRSATEANRKERKGNNIPGVFVRYIDCEGGDEVYAMGSETSNEESRGLLDEEEYWS